MNNFEEYLFRLRESVKRKPENDKERGFQLAVTMIYAMYDNMHPVEFTNSQNESLKASKDFADSISKEELENLSKKYDNITIKDYGN